MTLPPAAAQQLEALGENLAIARTRRRESQRAWAKRLGVSIPTVRFLEGTSLQEIASQITAESPALSIPTSAQTPVAAPAKAVSEAPVHQVSNLSNLAVQLDLVTYFIFHLYNLFSLKFLLVSCLKKCEILVLEMHFHFVHLNRVTKDYS